MSDIVEQLEKVRDALIYCVSDEPLILQALSTLPSIIQQVKELKGEQRNEQPVGWSPVIDAKLVSLLEKLSCLGNGEMPGNSIGNTMAQQALEMAKNPPYATIERDAERICPLCHERWNPKAPKREYSKDNDESHATVDEL